MVIFTTLFKLKFIFTLIKFLKRQKKLALTSFYCLVQEEWLDDSWKHICLTQSRFYNYLHVEKFKNA